MKTTTHRKTNRFDSHKPLLSLAAVFGSSALILTGCNKTPDPAPISTRETENARTEVRNYESSNTQEQKNRVELAFAELDQEIQELEIRVANTHGNQRYEAQQKLDALKAQRDALRDDFTEAKFQALLNDIKKTVF